MACFEAFDPAYDLPPEWSEPGDSGGGEAGADAPDGAWRPAPRGGGRIWTRRDATRRAAAGWARRLGEGSLREGSLL